MQVATVPMHITGTVACVYNFLTIFSLSSPYLTLSCLSLSLSRSTALSFFLSSNQSFFLSSIFLPLASVDHHCHRRSPSPPSIALSSFFSRCFRVEWAWLVGFGLNGVECLLSSPSPPLAFGGVDLVSRSCHHHRRRRSCCSRRGVNFGWVVWIVLLGLFRFRVAGLSGWVVLIPGASGLCGFRFVFLVFCRWVVWIPVWYQCGLVAVWVKKWIFYLNKRVE